MRRSGDFRAIRGDVFPVRYAKDSSCDPRIAARLR